MTKFYSVVLFLSFLFLLLSHCTSYILVKHNILTGHADPKEKVLSVPGYIQDISYGDKEWLAVGKDFILISKNTSQRKGKKWEEVYSKKDESIVFYKAAFGRESWVVVGSRGTILTSKNPVSGWRKNDSFDISEDLFGVAYGNGY